MAPPVSQIVAKPTAWRIVRALDPTAVAYALATSFAPIPIAAKNAKSPPIITIHKYILIKYMYIMFMLFNLI